MPVSSVSNCSIGGNSSSAIGIKFNNSINLDQGAGYVTGCTFDASATTGILAVADGLSVLGNYFYGNAHAIYVQATTGHALADLWIEGNHIEGQSTDMIHMEPAGTGTFVNVVIVGNEFSYESPGTGATGVKIGAGGSGFWVRNLVIASNVFGSYGNQYGIDIAEAWTVSISSNVFYSTSGTAINIAASCQYVKVSADNAFGGGGTMVVDASSHLVSDLPGAASAGAGAIGFVTNANATTRGSVVAGGGSNKLPVYSDGTNWLIT